MKKKTIITLVVALTVALIIAFGTIYFVMSKMGDESEEATEALEEEIDIETLQVYKLEPKTIKLVQKSSKPYYLTVTVAIYVQDEEMLKRVETLGYRIDDAILGIFETKTEVELEGKREEMKGVILEKVRELFSKDEDKAKIVDIVIPEYMIRK